MARGNPAKLQPVRNKQEASERGKIGGVKSGEARRRKRLLREVLRELMVLPSATLEGVDTQEAICAALVKKAEAGDVTAFTTIRDTIGERPADRLDGHVAGKLEISWQE